MPGERTRDAYSGIPVFAAGPGRAPRTRFWILLQESILISWEIPRLRRGGSNSLTYTGVLFCSVLNWLSEIGSHRDRYRDRGRDRFLTADHDHDSDHDHEIKIFIMHGTSYIGCD